MNTVRTIVAQLQSMASEERAEITRRFFKTGKGTYSEHDDFIGVRVPQLRQLAKEFLSLSLVETMELLDSPIHEQRHLALLIWTLQYKRRTTTNETREKIYNAYITSWQHINNWDLVDTTAPHIMGEHLLNRPRDILHQWSTDSNLWKRRMSIVATWAFIKRCDLEDTFTLATTLLRDKEDLMHKAVGWMLREAGKRDPSRLMIHLETYRDQMPRTMLRYSIEKFTTAERQYFLSKP